ncbi:hypothetical protein F5144DRAFT_568074 [Chaetomium tenue]|uniref:Uncharacterized protein n=1 Tax=Chaetomium tenue TaxID=1854479 RepID=A0ACB7PCV6_9PEZI|nr:hypothetical protein F5144DRAFT_568074 [Chaetomium globosum]
MVPVHVTIISSFSRPGWGYLSWWGIFQTKSHMMMMIHLCLLLELMARRLRAQLSLLHLVFKLVFCLASYLTYLPIIWRRWFVLDYERDAT